MGYGLFSQARGGRMKVGDLVRNIHTGEIGLITAEDDETYGCFIVCTGIHFWSNKKEHLEVISESW